MDGKQMIQALQALDQAVMEPLSILIGGGAAFILAHQIPLSTMDIDGIPYKTKLRPADLDPYVKKVAKKLNIPGDWLNSYFATFTYSLPKDYGDRLIPILQGKKITALALGAEDLLIMKCFAGREKDIPHVRLLLKKKLNLKMISKHLHQCLDEKLPNAQKACDFFYDLCEQAGIDV